MPNIRIITSVIGRAQRGIGRAQLNIGRASALPGLYKTTPVRRRVDQVVFEFWSLNKHNIT